MTKLNIHEAKTHLSRYTKRIKEGESVILCERNQPIAEIRPLLQAQVKPGGIQIGLYAGKFEVPADFDAPVPGFEQDFYGE